MTKQEQNHIALVAEISFPIRKLMVENLIKKGVGTIEAVDATDALRVMGEQAPNSLVLNNIGETSAIVFAKTLGLLKKTYNLATILIIRNPQMLEDIQKDPIRKSVVPILKYDSIDTLVDSIINAYQIASKKNESVDVDEQEIQSYASSFEAKQQKIKVEKLNHAYENFKKVVKLVKSDQLPGPMMPSMLMEVRKLLSDPEVEFGKVAKFISTHQALSAKIMSLANSVYYSRGNRTTTIKQAIVRLGIKEVGNILNAVAALEYIVGTNRQLRDLIASSLSKGYLVGLIGEFLGKITQSSKINEIYTAGLFHNIGCTFMLYTLSLLDDKGEIEEVNKDALTTMIANQAGKLNQMISTALMLPPEINFIYSVASTEDLFNDEESYFIRNYINQAIWTAEQILDNREGFLTCTTEAELLGLNEEIINRLNEKLPDFLGLLEQYEQLG